MIAMEGWVSVAGAALGFAATVVTSFVVWNRNKDQQKSNDADGFRADLLEFTDTLQKEMMGLRNRIVKMEEHNIEQNRTIIKLEMRIALIAHALVKSHGITVEQLLGETT